MSQSLNVPQADALTVETALLDDDSVSKLVHTLLEEYHVPGVSIAVVDKGSITAKVSLSEI